MSYQVLRACRSCGAPHPLVHIGALDPSTCPDCGEPASLPGATHTVGVRLSGVSGYIADRCFAAARALRNFAERL